MSADKAVTSPKCFDENIHRWYCKRAGDGICSLVKCVEAGANRSDR